MCVLFRYGFLFNKFYFYFLLGILNSVFDVWAKLVIRLWKIRYLDIFIRLFPFRVHFVIDYDVVHYLLKVGRYAVQNIFWQNWVKVQFYKECPWCAYWLKHSTVCFVYAFNERYVVFVDWLLSETYVLHFSQGKKDI